jgi:hypothetical protein
MQFTEQERAEFRELFGDYPEQLDEAAFKKALRALRAKYHPDNFIKFGDDTVQQLATERFQRIEDLAQKMENGPDGSIRPGASEPPVSGFGDAPVFRPDALFAYQALKIELRTPDKDLKYHLFGTFYRWLTLGEKFRIPGSKAFLVADESYIGRSIGFVESIRLYLTFEEDDRIDDIVRWFFEKIEGRAETILIEGKVVPVAYEAILWEIKRRSLKQLAG